MLDRIETTSPTPNSDRRLLVALLVEEERMIEQLRAQVLAEARTAAEGASPRRKAILAKALKMAEEIRRPTAPSLSAVLLDLADCADRLRDIPSHSKLFASIKQEYARARDAGLKALVDNDAVIDALRGALAMLRRH